MSLLRSLPLLFAATVLVGCGKPSKPALPPITEAEAESIKALEAGGAVLKKLENGAAVEVASAKMSTDAPFFDLVASLPSVRTVNLADSAITDESAPLFAKLPASLTSLDLRDCQLSDTFVDTLLPFKDLRSLRFSGKNGKTLIADPGITKLAELKNLKVLALDDLWVSTAALTALKPLTNLEELYLRGTLADDESCKVIASFPKLRKLRLARTQVSDVGLESLSTIKTLEELDLSEISVITNAGMDHLAKLTSLKKLNLWRVQVSDEGILKLATLTRLESLNLDNSPMSNGGLPVLKNMNSLVFLHLGSTQLTDAAAPSLFHLKNLKELNITRTALASSASAVAELTKQLPNTKIRTEYVEQP